jgi:hypothetical protein
MSARSQCHRTLPSAPVATWFYRPHLPSPAYPSGVGGLLVVTAEGVDRFFDVVSDGPGCRADRPIIVNGWQVGERVRGAAVVTIRYRPGEESDGGWPLHQRGRSRGYPRRAAAAGAAGGETPRPTTDAGGTPGFVKVGVP